MTLNKGHSDLPICALESLLTKGTLVPKQLQLPMTCYKNCIKGIWVNRQEFIITKNAHITKLLLHDPIQLVKETSQYRALGSPEQVLLKCLFFASPTHPASQWTTASKTYDWNDGKKMVENDGWSLSRENAYTFVLQHENLKERKKETVERVIQAGFSSDGEGMRKP